MKKAVMILLLMILMGCQSQSEFIYWTDVTENQIQRLNDAKLKYEVRDGQVWIKESDMFKVVTCCS
ncbi:hypothetical protein [Sporosarcina pasteurii]|uniref:Lipoprotein n=1 Tax=Sporosarcina pasteurii TaxID=1474 RepID=A0A380BT22_SPOPA|nr:hypothetical protein [Sporosarcina pasteurii]MDS9471272.1 hypothetical protein [Sporosarcina pasteurii]QBQ05096.1 hypothetical protein E2C16_05165 [Sporosarcina pasteurii]SUJ06596.1 Uncharacterised protein [Sporosarcina pasteurii]